MHWRRKWQPTPVFLPGESQGRGSLVGFRLWGRTESDMTGATWQQRQQQHIYYVGIYVCVFILSSYLNENRETLLLLIMCLHDHSLLAHADKPILFCTCKARLSQSWHCESVHFSHSVMSESL